MTWKTTPDEILDDVLGLIAKHSKPASEMTDAEWEAFAAGYRGGVFRGYGAAKLYKPMTNDILACPCGHDVFAMMPRVTVLVLYCRSQTCGAEMTIAVSLLEADANARGADGRIPDAEIAR